MGSTLSRKEKVNQEQMNDGCCYVLDMPDEILEAIFIHLEPVDLIRKVQFVCKSWYSVINRPSIWRLLCHRRRLKDPGTLRGIKDYRCYYFKLARNLIKNAWAVQKYEIWTDFGTRDGIEHSFGWETCYPSAVGCQFLPEEARNEFALYHDRSSDQALKEIYCWATTYYLCVKSQMVDLVRSGLTRDVIDSDLCPDIIVSEWVAARSDCASVYTLEAKLLDNEEKVLDYVEKKFERAQWEDGSWNKVTHVFSPVPVGTCYVLFVHSGQDRQFWAGHYGSKFTGATVQLRFKSK